MSIQGIDSSIFDQFSNVGSNIFNSIKGGNSRLHKRVLDFASKNPNATNIGLMGANALINFMPDQDKDHNSVDGGVKQARNLLADAAMSSGDPYLMGAGMIYKGLGKLGAFNDASQGLGTFQDVGNAVGAFIPYSNAFSSKTHDLDKSELVRRSSSYSNLYNTSDYNTAKNNASANLLFGVGKANNIIDMENDKINRADSIVQTSMENAEASQYTMPLFAQRTQSRLQGLYGNLGTGNAMRFGKEGMKIPEVVESPKEEDIDALIQELLDECGTTVYEDTDKIVGFKQGGNIIPEGALHARKHNLQEYDESLKGNITTKGIPVIVKNEDGTIKQQAEIEHSEIIFSKETTNKIEEYYEKYNKLIEDKEKSSKVNELLIEWGKFLADEIIKNTDDKTKLIKSVKI